MTLFQNSVKLFKTNCLCRKHKSWSPKLRYRGWHICFQEGFVIRNTRHCNPLTPRRQLPWGLWALSPWSWTPSPSTISPSILIHDGLSMCLAYLPNEPDDFYLGADMFRKTPVLPPEFSFIHSLLSSGDSIAVHDGTAQQRVPEGTVLCSFNQLTAPEWGFILNKVFSGQVLIYVFHPLSQSWFQPLPSPALSSFALLLLHGFPNILTFS